MKSLEYDLIAIGGGTAGLVSGAGAAYLGMRSAIVERAALGGDCLWTGCVPSKALIASARAVQVARTTLGSTSGAAGTPLADFARVMDRMREARARVAVHDEPERFRALGVGIHFGTARFIAPRALEVEGVGRLTAKRIVVGTGARAAVPPIPGLAEAGFLTNESAFELERLPSSFVVLGAGPIGLELAQVYARLGSSVTVLEMADRVLAREDPEAAAVVRAALEGEGIRFVLGQRAERVEASGDGKVVVTDQGTRLAAEELLVATGRTPAIADLDLERGGIDVAGGAVAVDEELATSARGVWAAGDVVGGPMFTHVADYQAKAVLRNAIFPFRKRVDYSDVPRVTFTDPELAHVGVGPEEAVEHGATESRYEFDDLDRAIVDGDTTGFVRIWTGRRGRIIGATVVGAHAGELVMPIVLAMRNRLPLGKLSDLVYPYPTRVEGIKRAADGYRKAQLTGTRTGALLRRVVSWLT